jgi:hypothetical protein
MIGKRFVHSNILSPLQIEFYAIVYNLKKFI